MVSSSFRWSASWHLHPRDAANPGMNVQAAWRMGITGKGVTVVHVDSGIDYNHPDLWLAYDADVSLDLAGGDDDPLNEGGDESSHGTSMAGLVGAAANNSVCSVGLAHEARIGMVSC